MANNGRRSVKLKKGPTVGTGGHGRKALEGKGPTPKAEGSSPVVCRLSMSVVMGGHLSVLPEQIKNDLGTAYGLGVVMASLRSGYLAVIRSNSPDLATS